MTALDDPNEEEFCWLRADGMTLHDAYNTAFGKELEITSAAPLASRMSRKVKISSRIDEILDERRQAVLDLARKYEVTRDAVIAKAVAGWNMAFKKGDLAAMSRHNNDMANFAREAYWNNKSEIALEGPIDQFLSEVAASGPYRPDGGGDEAASDSDGPASASQLDLQGS